MRVRDLTCNHISQAIFLTLLCAACSSNIGGEIALVPDAAPIEEPPVAPSINATLTPLLTEFSVPALAAAVTDGSDLLALGVVGIRKSDDTASVKLSDRFHLGSCTKAMTATLLATLVEEGALSWDTRLSDAFPNIDVDVGYANVTLAQLLGHRGGAWDDLYGEHADTVSLIPLNESVSDQRSWLTNEILRQPPERDLGEFAYSNASYVIVASAMEAVSGKSWEELTRTRLFEPLGMTSCGFGAPGSPASVDQPWGHYVEDGVVVTYEPGVEDLPSWIGPAGLVHCTVYDWAKFAALHIRGAKGQASFASAASFQRMHTPVPGPGEPYALGWEIHDLPDVPGGALSHTGSNLRWTSQVWIFPDVDRAFVSVTNQYSEITLDALLTVFNELIPRFVPGFGS